MKLYTESIKLYTEEQVRESLSSTEDNTIYLLNPIEIPGDEEIEKILYYRSNSYYEGFYAAITMLRNKIKEVNL